ncbi:MAG: DUF479 domain-containing protein [Bacteroidetes bacterium]|nr:MAG: DUF479 domain-containing protein [Bacteroidota bacterium]
MNFLAHLYLSFDQEQILIGNFIADFVKGKEFEKYSPEIQKGIILHRKIDFFTDQHPIVKQSVKRLQSTQGRYASVLVDVFYDYFLAKNWKNYHIEELDFFAQNTYLSFQKNQEFLPEKLQKILPLMIQNNWLVNYANFEGIDKSLKSLAKRATFESQILNALQDFQNNIEDYAQDFAIFFPDLIGFVKQNN